MRTGWLINLLLLVGVGGLLAYALWAPKEDAGAALHAISALSPASISKVRIQPPSGAPLELQKEGEEWFLVEPFRARADRSQVDRLLDIVSARSKEKLAATALERFDLDQPALKVVYDDQAIAFGALNPLSQEQYVLSGDSVYLLGSFYRSQVPEQPDRLLTHALLRAGENPARIRLKAFAVEQRDGKWSLTPAPKDPPSQDDLARWIDGWRLASSLYTEPATARHVPREWLEVALPEQQTLRLGIVERTPLVLLRPDERLVFHFSDEMSRRLLSAPVPEPAAPAGPEQ